ncbi:MAG: hypothetical protein WKF40_06980 [Thermoleophilaceae bacterium]
MRFLLPGVLAFAVAALGACGGGSEKKPPPAVSAQQRGVLDTVDRLQVASRRGDGEQICTEIFTTKLARSVEAKSKTSCAKEVKQKLFSPQAEARARARRPVQRRPRRRDGHGADREGLDSEPRETCGSVADRRGQAGARALVVRISLPPVRALGHFGSGTRVPQLMGT